MPVGRNDPCPCGSGKKYKRCHGATSIETNPHVVRANELKAIDVDLKSRLLRFAKTHIGFGWFQDAIDDYTGSQDADIPEHELSLAIPWALHFRRPDGGRTVAEEWAADPRVHATDRQRALIDAYSNAWLSIWKVTVVERGIGTALADQLTREERFAYDVSSSGTLTLHDSLAAIIIECDGVSFFGGAHPQPLPPRHAEAVVRQARRLCRVRTRAVDPDRLRDNDVQLELADAWNAAVDAMLGAPPPTLANTDGDLVAFTTDDFELTAPRSEVLTRLEAIPGAGAPEIDGADSAIVFTKSGNAMHGQWSNTVVGRAVVNDRRLRVETNSVRRADALRATIESHLSGMVRYRLRQETNTADLLTHPPAERRRDVVREPQPPEVAAIVREFRERYMRAWINDSIPALGGLTPRVAARTPRVREALESLVQNIERSESLLPQDEQIDLSWLRPELGIERDPTFPLRIATRYVPPPHRRV
jgi:hypothetical protein